jgi:hypothetical protein
LNETRNRAGPRSGITPEGRERQRALAKARWADPVAAEKWRAALYNPATRAKMSEASKARWADQTAREEMIAKFRASWADPVVRQKKASASKKRWADPAMREKMIAGMRTTPKRRRKKADTPSFCVSEKT